MQSLLRPLAILALIAGCSANPGAAQKPIKVEVIETDAGYELLRGGEPYTIRGAGMALDDLERFAAHGGNSIRTWSTLDENQSAQELLDNAHANGVTVALNLPVASERHGFDYDDAEAVAAQLASLRTEVLKYRDHPALLFWIIGNELNHSFTNPTVYDAVDDAARMIQDLDPNHPTTTTVSDFDAEVVATIEARAPALDFISFQLYGRLYALPEAIAASGFDDPFMVTEWGAIGYWEMETTDWSAPVEMTSSEKAETFLRGHREILSAFEGNLIGSYVFLWGQKQERTPTWFGLFTEDGGETEAVDVMHYIWNGVWPTNRSPRVDSMLLDGRSARDGIELVAGRDYAAVFNVDDPDRDPVTFRWEVQTESEADQSGGDLETPPRNLEGLLADPSAPTTILTAPGPGAYRLFAYAYDDRGNVAHANIPFKVNEHVVQQPDKLIGGEVTAVAYSGYREGQHPDRGEGAVYPSEAEILEDLEILMAHDLDLIRMYDSGENTRTTLELIRSHGLPIRVLLGIWLKAEVSNHLGSAWLDEPIPEVELAANAIWNTSEVYRGIELAEEFSESVIAVNVGNEALVDWNDHMVPVDRMLTYVRQVKAAIAQPVTVADNYAWWINDGEQLAAELDFIGVHTYPVWEDKPIDEALAYTIENIEGVRAALPNKPIAILEAGWATTASEFGDRANEPDQARYLRELQDWAAANNVTVFFFEAFDEPWKGDPDNPLGAEKHWGLFNLDRTPKPVIQALDL